MKSRGFTLIEMVMTIIVGSILVLGIAGFIELGARGYADTVERQRMQTQAKFVIQKISREVRHAVPNLLDNTPPAGALPGSDCVSFFPIVTSGFYAISGNDIQFVVGINGAQRSDLDGLTLIINPTTSGQAENVFSLTGSDFVEDTPNSGPIFRLVGEASAIVGQSVSNRHYIYDASNSVSYCLVGDGQVRRMDGNSDLPISDFGVSGSLNYQPATVQMNGLVHIDLTFTNEQGDESTTFQQEIQVVNVP